MEYARRALFVSGRIKAKIRWQQMSRRAPPMSIVAPLPLRSRKLPRNGVMTAAPIGNQRKMFDAASAVMPSRLHWSMLAP